MPFDTSLPLLQANELSMKGPRDLPAALLSAPRGLALC